MGGRMNPKKNSVFSSHFVTLFHHFRAGSWADAMREKTEHLAAPDSRSSPTDSIHRLLT